MSLRTGLLHKVMHKPVEQAERHRSISASGARLVTIAPMACVSHSYALAAGPQPRGKGVDGRSRRPGKWRRTRDERARFSNVGLVSTRASSDRFAT
jgi:hypothetical protein